MGLHRGWIAVMGLAQSGKALPVTSRTAAPSSPVRPARMPDPCRAGSASSAASGADFVFICVPDGDAMRDVVNEMGPSVEGSLVIDMTTTAAHDKSWAAAAVQAAGGDFIEALISGARMRPTPQTFCLRSGVRTKPSTEQNRGRH